MTELNDTYTIKIGEKEFTITMYAGLLRRLITASKMLTEPDAFVTDMDVQEKFVDLLLTEYDERGQAKGKYAEQFTLPKDVVEDLMVWGYDHCANFTINTGAKLTERLQKKTESLKKVLPPTQAG